MPIPERRVNKAEQDDKDGKGTGKTFKQASKFVLSSKLWEASTPSRQCDVVMTFPKDTDDYVVMWLLSRLRARVSELEVNVRQMANSKLYAFFLTTTYDVFKREAELQGFKKKLIAGGMGEFTADEMDQFVNYEDPAEFFTSGERQNIVLDMLDNLRAVEGDELQKVKFLEGQQIIPKLVNEGIISQIFPLHNNTDLVSLRKTWVKAVTKPQPLDDIRDYFGVKIAMYFAWLGMYTKWLVPPAALGIVMFWLFNRGEAVRDWCMLIFNIFNIVWATLYLEAWKRKSAELAYRWGTLDMPSEAIKDPRPEFKGDYKISKITGKLEPHYPSWKRNVFRYCVSLPVILLSLATVVVTMLLCFEFQRWVDGMENPPKPLKMAPKIALAVCVGLLDDNYKKIAYKLNDKENYRIQENYENHLIIKLTLFQFFNAYLSLFYIAFYMRDWDRLKAQLAAFLITKQIVGNVKEALIPFVKQKVKEWKQKKKAAKEKKEREERGEKVEEEVNPLMHQAELESNMPVYEDTFEDYLEMFIQFGYVVLFSSAFPLAALCALANNVIEIRSDAFKMVTNQQRPFGVRVENIGTWQDALEVMGVVAVMVNLALMGMSGSLDRMFPGMTAVQRVLIIVILEHIVLAIKCAVAYAIPDIPEWVEEEIAKVEYRRREALKPKINTDDSASKDDKTKTL